MKQITDTGNISGRNYGIDLLRLVAAFYVIILHTLNYGGVYYATAPFSYQNLICRILLIAAFCAVNIFGIISGYVGYREPPKKVSYNGYLSLWLTVVFYCVFYAGIYQFLQPGIVTVKTWAKSFFPVTKDLYWYFSAYTFVYFLSPYLNKILYHSSERELKALFWICCVAVMIEYISKSFAMEGGYSAMWLLLLYLVGGIMKKTGIGSKIPACAALLLIILIDGSLFYFGLKRTDLTVFIFNFSLDLFYSYITPFYFTVAILHVILFSQLKIGTLPQKIIKFAAPAAFSVYIANTSPLFWHNFMQNHFADWAASSPAGILVRTITFSFFFVWAVIFFDFFRQKLFRLLGVQNWIPKLSAFLLKDKAL